MHLHHFIVLCTAALLSLPVIAADQSIPEPSNDGVSDGDNSVELQNGVSQPGTLDVRQWSYYRFSSPDAGTEMSIVLTVLSGDADLYVSNTTDTPNGETAEWHSAGWGSDSIDFDNAAPGTYHIGVTAYTNATYTLMAFLTTSNGASPDTPCDTASCSTLVDGQPVNQKLHRKRYKYYRFELPANAPSMTVSCSPRVGDPDLMLNAGTAKPSTTAYQWSSSSVGTDVITVHDAIAGPYTLAVYAYSSSDYTLTFKTGDATMTLIAGTPFREDLMSGQYEYFVFDVNSLEASKDLTISLSMLTGDADIFASTIHERPTSDPTMHEYAGQSYRDDAITVPATELKVTRYYIGVYAFTTCTYTIIASLNTPLQLHDGTPQTDTVLKEQTKYYRLNVKMWRTDANIAVTPFSGNVELYVSNVSDPIRNDPTTYQFSSAQPYSLQSVSITARQIRQMRCKDWTCTLYIAVYGAVDAEYTILASSSNSSTTLQEGKPATGNVAEHTYRYYQFNNVDNTAAVIFTLTTATGDADLFATLCSTTQPANQPCNTTPNITSHTWSSRRVGEDVIVVDSTDPSYGVGIYYVGVYGYGAAAYTLTASLMTTDHKTSSRTALVDGLASLGYADTDESKLYTFHMPTSTEAAALTITATPKSGDIDLFVLIDKYDGTIPSADHNDYKSTQWGRDSITVSSSCTDCDYLIAARAYSKSLFTITTTTHSSMTQLLSGVSHRDTVSDHSYRYYYFVVDKAEAELVISVTAVTGDPDVYASTTATNQRPTSTDYDYHSLNYGTDIITIPSPQPGNVYVGIYGFRNSTYQLTATLGTISLVNSEPHSDILSTDDVRVYAFDYSDTDANSRPLTFEVDTVSNSARFDMYVCNSDEADVQCDSIDNIRTKSQWRYIYDDTRTDDYVSSTQTTIPITHDDAHRCTGTCTYKVAVAAKSRLSYSILATYGSVPTLLSEGRSSTQSVQQGQMVYYRFNVDSYTKAISIDCTELLGDVKLVADIVQPTETSHWQSPDNKDSAGNHIGIAADDDYLQQMNTDRTLYIGVIGVAATSRFTISATTQNRLLTAGQPVLGSSMWGDTGDFYAMFVDMEPGKPQDVIFRIEHHSKAAVSQRALFDIYIHTNATVTTEPDQQTYVWHKQVAYDEALTIYKDDPLLCTSCTYYVGIFTSAINTKYLITGTTDDSLDLMFGYSSLNGTLECCADKYYEIYVASAGMLQVTLETCTGQADLYISSKTRQPKEGAAQYESTRDDDIDQVKIDEGITDQSFYIGVHARSPQTTYVIRTLTTSDPPVEPVIHNKAIKARNVGSGSVELVFDRAATVAGGDADAALMYSVHSVVSAENDAHAVMYSACGLQHVTQHAAYTNEQIDSTGMVGDDGSVHVMLEGLDSDKTYDFNVMVMDSSVADLQHNRALYRPAQGIQPYDPNSVNQTVIRYMLYVGLPVSIGVICVMVYLCINNRRLASELAIELNDVSASSARKEMRSSLLSGQQYVPPTRQQPARGGERTTQDRYAALIDEQGDSGIDSDDDGRV